MPEHDRQAGGAQAHRRKERHLANARKRCQHHDQIGGHRGQQGQQQRIADFRQALPGRGIGAMHHALGEVIERVIGGDADDAHAHHQRHQVQLAKHQQRHNGARQRANGNREQA